MWQVVKKDLIIISFMQQCNTLFLSWLWRLLWLDFDGFLWRMTQLFINLVFKNLFGHVIEGIWLWMTWTWVKLLATEEIWSKQNCLTYGLYDDFNYELMWNLYEVIKQEINYILLNDWQNYCVACTLMVCRVWRERQVREQKESISMQRLWGSQRLWQVIRNLFVMLLKFDMFDARACMNSEWVGKPWQLRSTNNYVMIKILFYEIWCIGLYVQVMGDNFQSTHFKWQGWEIICVILATDAVMTFE